MKKILSMVFAFCILCGSVFVVPITGLAYEASTDTLDVYGYTDYQKAFDCLDEVNLRRSKNYPLVMDRDLMDIAMARAAEAAVYFSHTRPKGGGLIPAYGETRIYNGKEYSYEFHVRQVGDNQGTLAGENLAGGSASTGKYVVEAWNESQGHKDQFMNIKWKSTGVGCFEFSGCFYWIQVFASFSADNPVTREEYPNGSNQATFLVEAANEDDKYGAAYSLEPAICHTEYGEPYLLLFDYDYMQNMSRIFALKIVNGIKMSSSIIDPAKVIYRSSDPSKVSINKNGEFKILVNENTTVTLYATYLGKEYSKSLNLVKEEEPEPCTHYWLSTELVDPTCTKAGVMFNWCLYCDEEYTNTIPAAGHSYGGGKATASTCTSQGYTTYNCVECGSAKKDKYTSLKSHTSKSTTTKATSSKDGKTVKACTACKKTLSTTAIPKASNIKLSATSYTYDGKTKAPGITVKDSKGKTLKNGTDYTLSYQSGRKNVGQYTVTINFKGNYSGSVKKTFTIKPKSTSVSKVADVKKGFKVTWKKQTAQVNGYQIQYSTDKNFKSNNKTVSITKNSTTSKSISKLKGKKKYYVRVRTYKTVKVNGKNVKIYSNWSGAKAVTTKK